MKCVNATFNKKGVNSTVLEDQIIFGETFTNLGWMVTYMGVMPFVGEICHTTLPLPPLVGLTYKTPWVVAWSSEPFVHFPPGWSYFGNFFTAGGVIFILNRSAPFLVSVSSLKNWKELKSATSWLMRWCFHNRAGGVPSHARQGQADDVRVAQGFTSGKD